MSYELNRTTIGEKIHFKSVHDPKFKNKRLSVTFSLQLAKDTASDLTILPFLLRKVSRESPDFSSLNDRLTDVAVGSLAPSSCH